MTRVEEWRPYNVNKQVGGWVEVFDKMTIATVRNAGKLLNIVYRISIYTPFDTFFLFYLVGHEVPQYQQERSLYLFDKFLKNERL